MEKNHVNHIILMKVFAGGNAVKNEKSAIFYDETDTLMHRFEIYSLISNFSFHEND